MKKPILSKKKFEEIFKQVQNDGVSRTEAEVAYVAMKLYLATRTNHIAWKVFRDLVKKGAGIGNASTIIIDKTLSKIVRIV